VGVVIVLLIVSIIVGAFAITQRNSARTATNDALARGLSAQSATSLSTKQNDLALLLASEAERFGSATGSDNTATHEAQNALLGAVGAQTTFSRYLAGQPGTAWSIAYSPNGRTIVSGSEDGQIRMWDAATGRQLAHAPTAHSGGVFSVAMNNAGLLATCCTSGSHWVHLWDAATGQPWRWQPPHPKLTQGVNGGTFPIAVSSRGVLATSFFGSGPAPNALDLWDTASGRRIGSELHIDGNVDALAFSPDGSSLAVGMVAHGGTTMDVQLVDVHTGSLGLRFVAHRAKPGTPFDPVNAPFFTAVAFTDGGRLVSSVMSNSPDGAIVTFDAATGAELPPTGIAASQNVLGVSADLDRLVVSVGPPYEGPLPVSIIDAKTAVSMMDIPAAAAPNIAVLGAPLAVDPTRPQLVFQRGPGALGILNWREIGPSHFARATAMPPLGPTVALTPTGSAVDLTTPLRILRLGSDPNPVRPWHASSSGQVAILDGSTIAIWDPATGRIVRRLTGAPSPCTAAFQASLSFVGTATKGALSLGCQPTLLFWDLSKPGSEPAWSEHWPGPRFDEATWPVVSPAGTTIADTDLRGINLLDASTGRMRAIGPGIVGDQTTHLAFSPDSRILAAVLYSGDVDLVNATTGSLITVLKPRTSAGDPALSGFPNVAISPNDEYVAAWHRGGGVELWDVASGASLAVLNISQAVPGPLHFGDQPTGWAVPGYGSSPFTQAALTFSPDGSALRLSLMIGFQSGSSAYNRVSTAQWSIAGAGLARAACAIARRDLTTAEWDRYVGAGVPYHHTCTDR
jgi:WD40 repeat protein